MHRFASLLVVSALWIAAAPARAAEKPDFFAPRAGMDADTALYLDAWSGNANAVLANYSAVVFDFNAMRFSVGPPTALSAEQKALF